MKIKIKTQTKFRLGQNQDQDEDQDEDQDQVQVIPRPRPGRRPRWERENWIRSRLRAGELCFPPIHWKKVKNAKKFGICTSKNIRLAIFLMLLLNRGEREFPFLSIPKNESLWFPFPNYGNGFLHSLPVQEFRECFFFIPFPFPNYGNGFFHSLPLPKLWEWFFFIPFPFPNFGNGFFHSLPVPELWEWFFFIPFPFPTCGNGFFSFPSRSRIVGMDFFNSLPIPEFAISQTGIKTGIGLL